jgi:hypothetical protein
MHYRVGNEKLSWITGFPSLIGIGLPIALGFPIGIEFPIALGFPIGI